MRKKHEKKSAYNRYLIANEQDLLWGLTINTVGRQVVEKGEPYPPENHPTRYLFSTDRGRILDEYQLLYISKGTGTFTSQSCKTTEIHEGNIFLLFPGEWHSYKPNPQTGWEEYWIGFKGENIDNRIKNGFFSKQKPIFYVGILEEIVHLYNQAITIARDQRTGFQQMLAGIVNHLLGLAYSLGKYSNFEDMKVTNQINKAKIIFLEKFKTGVQAQQVAEDLNMSYSWFRRIFKEYTGFAPAQYVQELRIHHSKELLTNTNLSVKEVAFEAGFENIEYFCTTFKKRTAYTPVQYREFTQGKTITDNKQ